MLCVFSWVSSVIAGTMGLKFIFPSSSRVQFSAEGPRLTTEMRFRHAAKAEACGESAV